MTAATLPTVPMELGGGTLLAAAPDLVVARFAGVRRVLSDAAWNGGWVTAAAVANHRMRADAFASADGQARYCRALLSRHGLPPNTPLLLTAAAVTAGGCVQNTECGVRVTAHVSAGVRHNAVWAGDPASYREEDEAAYVPLPPGTVNMILIIEARLAEPVFPHLFTLAAEVKADGLRACGVRSCYSERPATGTGTDSTVVVADPRAARGFVSASTHSQLGMAVARAVRAALMEALRGDGFGGLEA